MTAISTHYLSAITRFRNPGPETSRVTLVAKACLAEVAYLFGLPLAIVEAVACRLALMIVFVVRHSALEGIRARERSAWQGVVWNVYCLGANCLSWQLPAHWEGPVAVVAPAGPSAVVRPPWVGCPPIVSPPAPAMPGYDPKLGPNATRFINYDIRKQLPLPNREEYELFKEMVLQVIEDFAPRVAAQNGLNDLHQSAQWDQLRADSLRMLYALYQPLLKLVDKPAELKSVKEDLQGMFATCQNKRSSAIEELFNKYGYQTLEGPEERSMQLVEKSLIADLQAYRSGLLQGIITQRALEARVDQSSNATHLGRMMAPECFLPIPPLNGQDMMHLGCARESLKGPVLIDFQKAYTRQAIFEYVKNCSLHGGGGKLTPRIFADWAVKHREKATHFNPDTGEYTDRCIMDFLVEHRFVVE